MRKTLKSMILGFLVGALSVGAALAGVGLVPVPSVGELPTTRQVPAGLGDGLGLAAQVQLDPAQVPGVVTSTVTAPSSATPLADGAFLVGANRTSIYPAPTLFGGSTWQTSGCTEIDESNLDQDHVVASIQDMRGWPAASPDCIYLGGFGIGPARAAHEVDAGGVWIRSLAISNGAKTFVYQITDTVGWFARYHDSICTDCGLLDIRQRIATDTGINTDDVVIASTHSHATADTYGGWGGIPNWYRNQLRDSSIASAKQAIANLQAATLAVGEVQIRSRNNERRDTYHSTADTGATWIQAKAASDQSVIATLGTFAGHATIVDGPILHADWPGAASRKFETDNGGVGLMFEGGLGNVSIRSLSSDPILTGDAIAQSIEDNIVIDPRPITSNTMSAAVYPITHPVVSNPGLTTLASAGLFDREFTPGTPGADGPGAYHWSKPWSFSSTEGGYPGPVPPTAPNFGVAPVKGGEVMRACDSAGPIQIKTVAGGHRIGNFLVTFAPGEIFSNITRVVKEKSKGSSITMPIGQANDALGYIIQSFEFDYQGGAPTEYGTGTGEYEEVFSIDHCFGNHVLDAMLRSISTLGLS